MVEPTQGSMDSTQNQGLAPMVSANDFGLIAKLTGPSEVRLADTFEIIVEVTWKQAPHSWLLLPQNSPESKSVSLVSQFSAQSQTLSESGYKPSQQIHYRLVASDTGSTEIPAVQFKLPLAQGGEISLQSNPLPLVVKAPVAWGLWGGIAFVILAVALVAVFFKRKQQRKLAQQLQDQLIIDQFAESFEQHANRVLAANPSQWLIEFLPIVESGLLLLKKGAFALSAEQSLFIESLRKAQEQARYGGGPRDAWENKEKLREARNIFNDLLNQSSKGNPIHG